MGISLGIIFMTAIYNAVLYHYNREKAFLYYTLMQLGMLGVLFYDESIMSVLMPTATSSEFIYTLISLYTLFFILMFARSFLEIDENLGKHSKVLNFIFYFIIFDALFFPLSLIFDFGLFLFIFLYIVYLGYIRVKQDSKPAKFYLLGWGSFVVFVFMDGFTDISIETITFNPIVIGSVLEAIILAIALAYQLNERKKEQIKQQQLLVHQSKLASMGEMLGNISHQWRQPLTRLSYTFMNIEYESDEKERSTLVLEGTEQLEFMSQTIDDFTNFYAPSKEKESFSLKVETQKVLELVYYDDRDIDLEVKKDCTLFNYKNEFKQVLLNLLSNGNEVLIDRQVTTPKITIVIDEKTVTVSDNAGGIDLDDIEKIFEPYFTTKESGLGLGLYMSKMIIEKNMGGSLSVRNTEEGAKFTLSF